MLAHNIRMTARACEVLSIARDEARLDLSPIIMTQHLLRGLMAEGTGIAAGILSEFADSCCDASRHENEIAELADDDYDELIRSGESEAEELIGYSRDVFERASTEASRLYDILIVDAPKSWAPGPYIGTEHLLLGMLECPGCDAFRWLTAKLQDRGSSVKRMSDALLSRLGARCG